MTRYIKKPKRHTNGFTVIQDVQEKNPWKLIWPVEVKHLKTGDYSIKGLEDKIAIEKKSGLVELLNDLSASYRTTFERFLKRLSEVPVKCIVVDEPLSEWRVHKALKIVKKKSRGKSQLIPRTLYYWTAQIVTQYGIPVLFLDEVTREKVLKEIFRSAFEKAKELK
uniref:ERCC4 domain-containing protein n=2 Tax=viral metagenome TaxID=1070528 RepID=A0A6M3IZI3_9ZZZZ